MIDADDQNTVLIAMREWVKTVVIGHNLCPFARDVFGRLRIRVSTSSTLSGILEDAQNELSRLVNTHPDTLPTSILACPNALLRFDDYLDALELLEAGLIHAGLEGEIQIASFHPQYQFADTDVDDPANATNRSPVPAFHFLREDHVDKARQRHPDTEGIPLRNVELFRKLGPERVEQLLADCWSSS